MRKDAYDYIIVGAGSAGAPLAARLSEDRDVSVLLIEAGPPDRHWSIRMPAAYAHVHEPCRYNWGYWTVPQAHLDSRRLFQPAGKTLGGTSSINGMVFIRGHALDYERWVAEGAAGWGYADVLPYFRRSETYRPGANDYRGGDGPVTVDAPTVTNVLNETFLAAGQEAGYAATADFNGYQQEGFGRFNMNIARGVRASTAQAYLDPARGRPNLTILTGAEVTRVLLEKSRATGVEFLRRGRLGTARAGREVVVSGGAIHSPRLLMLSGIGPADHLRALGIPVAVDLPGVGENLQDHLYFALQYQCRTPTSLNPEARPHRQLAHALRWFLARDGLAALNHVEVGALVRSATGLLQPDIQCHFWPVFLDGWRPSRTTHGFRLSGMVLRPTSRGTIRLASADPLAAPLIDHNLLATDADMTTMRSFVKLFRAVVAQRAFDPHRGAEVSPGKDARTDRAIDAYLRAHAHSGYHLSGTCRMGMDAMAVLDPLLRVRGIEGLRVADASIMPSEVSANTNATSIMIGEKAADIVRGRTALRSDGVPYYLPPDAAAHAQPKNR